MTSAVRKHWGGRFGPRRPKVELDLTEVLLFIEAYLRKTGGVSPSQAEIARHFGLTSRGSATFNALKTLEARGKIRQLRGARRAIEVLQSPIPIYDAATHQIRGYVS